MCLPMWTVHTHTHTRVYQRQGLRCPVALNLHEAGIMASAVALSVSNVPRRCSRLVPISRLLACWSPPPPLPARSAARARKDQRPPSTILQHPCCPSRLLGDSMMEVRIHTVIIKRMNTIFFECLTYVVSKKV